MSRRPLVWLLLAASIGCSSSHEANLTLPPTSPDVIGTFALTSSDGVAPPFTAFTTATEQWRLQSDALVIAPDGTWSETTNFLVFQLSDGSSATHFSVVSGNYVIANGQINFTMTNGGSSTFVGSVSGNVLIVIFNGKRFAYSR
jgi:hypothetical protein